MPGIVRTPRRTRHKAAGQSLVEFALVLPILLVIFSAAADLGRAFYGYVALENAVKEGAIFGSRYPLCDDSSTLCPDPDNVRWRVENEARNLKNTDGTFRISPASACLSAATGTAYSDLRDCVAGDTFRVRASLTFNLITPILNDMMGGGFTFTSEARATVLNQAFDPTPGLAPTKLILAAGARNASEITSKCQQPDPTGSAGYYRSPCLDVASDPPGPDIVAKFQPGDTITYKIIVRNNGGTNVTSITMNDSLGWPVCPVRPTSMAVGSTPYTCTYTRTAPVPGSGTSMDYINTLTVDGLEIDPAVESATAHIDLPPARLQVLKSVSTYALGNDGDGNPSFGTNDNLSVFFNGTSGNPTVWYRITVTNTGGQPALGLNVTDTLTAIPYGQNNATAVCDAKPASLAKFATWTCRYRATLSGAQTRTNTASATATNVTPDFDDSHSATVTNATCAGPNKVVPNLIGMSNGSASSAWTNAGFTGAFTGWSGSGNAVTQNRQAYSCLPATTTITVTKDPTP